MSLSVCCATSDPGPQLAAVLGQLRPVADEIVVAVDERHDPKQLGHYARVADRLLRFEFGGFVERSLPWLHAECEADWILHIDGDEVASPALVSLLPELTRARDVVQYFIAYRWLFPDEGHWIDQRPWFYYTNRLVRNDPGTMWIPGIAHVPAAPVGPARYVDAPLYHLTCLLTDIDQRTQKIRRYEQLDRSLKLAGSDEPLLQCYLPEITGHPNPVPVPEADREAIRAVLRASGSEQATPTSLVVPLARLVDTDGFWPERHLPAAAYVGSIEVIERDLRLGAGEHRQFYLRVTNDGTTSWPGGDDRRPLIRVAYRWLLEDGTVTAAEGYRTPFPAAVAPGTDCVVPAVVAGPDEPGRYILEFDLVHELVRWFGCPTRIPLEVSAGRGPYPDVAMSTEDLDIEPAARDYIRAMHSVPGWLYAFDALVLARISRFQSEAGIVGDVLEIGAYLGRTAILLGCLMAPHERLVVCDLFDGPAPSDSIGAELTTYYIRLQQIQFERNYLRFHTSLPVIHACPSSELAIRERGMGFRLVHLDGSHLEEVVRDDMRLARDRAVPGGIVVFDDWRSPHTPGVPAAFWPEVAAGRLIPFCFTDQKMYAAYDQPADSLLAGLEHWAGRHPGLAFEWHEMQGRRVARIYPSPG